jgi:hypothetical protein
LLRCACRCHDVEAGGVTALVSRRVALLQHLQPEEDAGGWRVDGAYRCVCVCHCCSVVASHRDTRARADAAARVRLRACGGRSALCSLAPCVLCRGSCHLSSLITRLHRFTCLLSSRVSIAVVPVCSRHCTLCRCAPACRLVVLHPAGGVIAANDCLAQATSPRSSSWRRRIC